MGHDSLSSSAHQDQFIGLVLAVSSSVAIGGSLILTKKGLIEASEQDGELSSDSYSYLKNGTWWIGATSGLIGEIANFAAYTYAPPIIVAPLGALSVIVGTILATLFLNERLDRIGAAGCFLCLVGSVIIIMHAPEDIEVTTFDEILGFVLQPGFITYCVTVMCFCVFMIYRVAPTQGNKNPLVYISICALAGSVSVMAVKTFGIALKLTFAGKNQMGRPETWVFPAVIVGCIVVQAKYLSKALELFPTTIVNPIYFVGFSTSTIFASVIMFRGINNTGGPNAISLFCGLSNISVGVYLLNTSRSANEEAAGRRHSIFDVDTVEARVSLSRRASLSHRISMSSTKEEECGLMGRRRSVGGASPGIGGLGEYESVRHERFEDDG